MMPLYKFLGFAPDVDRTTPGVITDCESLVPSVRGMEGAPAESATGLPTVVGTAVAAAVMRKLDYTSRFFVASPTTIQEAMTSTTWSTVGSGSASNDFPWRFAQFGDVSLAISTGTTLMASSAAGSVFTSITGGPVGAIVETVNQFVFAFDTGLGDDYWQCSALGDYTSWTASITTQAANGRLSSSPGRITAAKRLGDNIVAYKYGAMYIGQYVGGLDNTWAFQQIPGEVGATGQEAVVSVGYQHYFYDGKFQDFFVFDGSRPVPIGESVREWFYENLDKEYSNRIRALHDRDSSRIYWFYPPVGGTGALTAAIVLNYKTMQWGRDAKNIYVPVEYVAGATTLNELATLYTTYNGLPDLAYDSPFWNAGSLTPAVVNTSRLVTTLTGVSSSSSLTTGDLGDDIQYLRVRRIKPKYLTKPSSGTLRTYIADDLGDSFTQDKTVTESDCRYDFLRSSRWHRFKLSFTGDVELNAMNIDILPDGSE